MANITSELKVIKVSFYLVKTKMLLMIQKKEGKVKMSLWTIFSFVFFTVLVAVISWADVV